MLKQMYGRKEKVERSRGSFGRRCWPLLQAAVVMVSVAGCVSTDAGSNRSAGPVMPPMAVTNPTLAAPIPPPSPNAVQEIPSGSLWTGHSGSLFQDIKAVKVGDVITITVSEDSKASNDASTQTTRKKDFSGSFKFAGAGLGANGPSSVANPAAPMVFGPYQGNFSNGFNGTGTTTRNGSMTAYMSASVVDVMPNGNLIIRGSRWTKVNDEMQQIVLEGIVRPMDVTRNNTVLSQNIAEAKIFIVGKGPVASHQKPGWVGQLLDLISPF